MYKVTIDYTDGKSESFTIGQQGDVKLYNVGTMFIITTWGGDSLCVPYSVIRRLAIAKLPDPAASKVQS
jgi:hypothetical protein